MKNVFFVVGLLLIGNLTHADSVGTCSSIKGVINLEAGIKNVRYEVDSAIDGYVQILFPSNANARVRSFGVTMDGGCSVKMSGNVALVAFGDASPGQACYLQVENKGDNNLPLAILTLYTKTK